MPIALSAQELCVRFGQTVALADFSLDVPTGSISALLGPNGAGKTTFIRCCIGLVQPEAGKVEIFGNQSGSAAARSLIGFMPQTTGAWSTTTARRLLNYLAQLYANPQSVEELMDLLDISGYADRPYRRLSGGQQQCVNLAAALIGRPRLIFLDEPTSGLDPRARRYIWDLLKQIRKDQVSIFLTTHNMEETTKLADQVAILHHGRIRARGSVAELKDRYTSVEHAFLAVTEGR